MRLSILMGGMTILCVAAAGLAAQAAMQDRPELVRSADRQHRDSAAPISQIVSYGPDRLQKIDFYAAPGKQAAPLVIFVHGGGWKRGDKAMMDGSAKLTHWRGQGYAVASVNYRLVPAARVEDQAADVAAAVAALRRQARSLGFDPSRIVLSGHSAGAHLVALVGTDPQWLQGAGLGMDAVRGVLAIDGAGYFVPDQMNWNRALMGDTYQQAFGTDPARQKALSPTAHADAPNAPAFLVIHVDGRADAAAQSESLAKGLRMARTPVELKSVPGRGLRGHRDINRRLGEVDYPATAIVDAWLAAVFAR